MRDLVDADPRQPLERIHAADALAAHRERLSPRAVRLLTELQRLGDEAGA